jgi:hypothetical protein
LVGWFILATNSYKLELNEKMFSIHSSSISHAVLVAVGSCWPVISTRKPWVSFHIDKMNLYFSQINSFFNLEIIIFP